MIFFYNSMINKNNLKKDTKLGINYKANYFEGTCIGVSSSKYAQILAMYLPCYGFVFINEFSTENMYYSYNHKT